MAEIKSEKGKVMAVCGNYPMRKDYVSANKLTQYWRCSMEGCHARAQSAFGSLVLKETRAHDLRGGSPATIEEKRREKRRLEDQLRRVKKAEDRVRQQTSYQSSQNNQKTHMAKLHHPMPDDEVEVVVNVPVQDPPQQPQNLDDWDMNED
uniref:FLYWCH-type domain-containing protein n=1 Tax=Ditylenchus dipsaci TaxID=166011 RepID=A0A915EKY0_9BILA